MILKISRFDIESPPQPKRALPKSSKSPLTKIPKSSFFTQTPSQPTFKIKYYQLLPSNNTTPPTYNHHQTPQNPKRGYLFLFFRDFLPFLHFVQTPILNHIPLQVSTCLLIFLRPKSSSITHFYFSLLVFL